MEKLTVDEIITIAEEIGIDIYEFACGGDDDELIARVGKSKQVASGGGMDRGSDWYRVNYFEDHDVYIKTEGYYSSGNGVDFSDGYGHQVFPEQKTITVYNSYKK